MGELKIPKGKDGQFSLTNWRDYEFLEASTKDKKEAAKTKLKQHATIFQSCIDMLQDNHWMAIMDGACQYIGKKQATILKEEIEEKMDE
jgi:hypothetical protein